MSSLLNELGIDPDDFEWRDLALCRNMRITAPGEDVFYDKYESDSESAKAADQICLHCPVIQQCFFEGAQGQTGVWGGVYWNGSGKPDKNKNNHKTEEDWDNLYKMVGKK